MSENGVIIFEHGNFVGKSQILRPGYYDITQLQIGNDQLSSLRIPAGWKVTLFADAGFKGKSVTLDKDAPSVKEFNDLTSSICVDRPWPLLKRGTKLDEVVALQNVLIKLGHHIDADGVVGPKTEAAIKAFQKANALDADGVVGKGTWAILLKHMP